MTERRMTERQTTERRFYNIDPNVEWPNVKQLNVDYDWTLNYFKRWTILNVKLFVRTLI
jgi:hypothetical protein